MSPPTRPHLPRPAFHFTPPSGWMNDPNGLVQHRGVYHLFYQYHPHATVWGPMHWGHASSRDLLAWTDHGVALAPDRHGFIFSGSAVVDHHNSSGFGSADNPPLVAIFTYHQDAPQRQSQGLAYSLDNGESWLKYAGNPVLHAPAGCANFRDPKVRWHAPSGQWIMALSASDHTLFYASANLRDWRLLSRFGDGIGAHGGVWECPDLVPLPIEGSDEQRWLLLQSLNPGGPNGGSATQYFIGDFDGERFCLDAAFARQLDAHGPHWLDWGGDHYAGVTFANLPASDPRTVLIGWMNNWLYGDKIPSDGWRGTMTLPRTLRLRRDASGVRLISAPIEELDRLHGAQFVLPPQQVIDRSVLPLPADALSLSMLDLVCRRPTSGRVGLDYANPAGDRYRLGYDSATDRYFSDRSQAGQTDFSDLFARAPHTAPRCPTGDADTLRWRLILDRTSIEWFADDGATTLTEQLFPRQPFSSLTAWTDAAPLQIETLTLTTLRPAS